MKNSLLQRKAQKRASFFSRQIVKQPNPTLEGELETDQATGLIYSLEVDRVN